MQFDQLERRVFISLLGGAVAWQLGARAAMNDTGNRIPYKRIA
jgi:hypothetical protein